MEEEELRRGLNELSQQVTHVLDCLKDFKEKEEARLELRPTNFWDCMKVSFRLAKHTQDRKWLRNFRAAKLCCLLELDDVTRYKAPFTRLESSIREAERLRFELIDKSGQYAQVGAIFRDLNVLWLINTIVGTAERKIEYDIEKGDSLNTIASQYMWKARNAVEPHIVQLEAIARYLRKAAAKPFCELRYLQARQGDALPYLVLTLKHIAHTIRSYSPSKDFCADFDAFVTLEKLRWFVREAEGYARRALQVAEDPALVESIRRILKLLLPDRTLMDLFGNPELMHEAPTNVMACFKKAAEHLGELEGLTASLEVAIEEKVPMVRGDERAEIVAEQVAAEKRRESEPVKEPQEDELITLTGVAKLLGVDKGTVSRWADEGKIQDNKQKGRRRRVSRISVLLLKDKREREDLLRDAAEDLQDRASKIPDRH
jgi:excisionase family DNA binding protein